MRIFAGVVVDVKCWTREDRDDWEGTWIDEKSEESCGKWRDERDDDYI